MLKLIQKEIAREGIPQDHFISFNFESFNTPRTAEALYSVLSQRISAIHGKYFLFLDEIQEVQHWEKCINSLRVDYDCDIYITGSNAKLLSSELATYLAGRYVQFIIYPFSFREFLDMPYMLADETTAQREFGAYRAIHDNFPKYVVSLDDFTRSREDIKHLNITDFLLSEQWT